MKAALVVVLLYAAGSVAANGAIIGSPANGRNALPFSCAGDPDPGCVGLERYQQIHDASLFAGPITVVGLNFFLDPLGAGNISSGVFTFSLSTTLTSVAGLDKVNLDDNVGSDVELFATVNLSGGPAPDILSFDGGLFDYDPSQGNLHISFANASHSGPLAFYQSLRGGPIARGFGQPGSDQQLFGTQGLVVLHTTRLGNDI